MNNQVIEVLNEQHGREVKKYFESKGVNEAKKFTFNLHKEDGDDDRYYGIIDDVFGHYSLKKVLSNKAEIIELPKKDKKGFDINLKPFDGKVVEIELPRPLPIPRKVMVRDNNSQTWKTRELLADLTKYNVRGAFICRNENGTHTTPWRQMKELPTEVTKDQAEKMLSELKGVEIKIK